MLERARCKVEELDDTTNPVDSPEESKQQVLPAEAKSLPQAVPAEALCTASEEPMELAAWQPREEEMIWNLNSGAHNHILDECGSM